MVRVKPSTEKIVWSGRVVSVQPRIRMLRSFDERQHSYLGYVLNLEGIYGDESGKFLVAIGKGAQNKHAFQVGMEVSGQSIPVDDPCLETAGFYKTSKLKIVKGLEDQSTSSPPFRGVPPDLPTLRERGHRRLDAKTYSAKCESCIWGCRMPVEIIIDQWNPSAKRKYRFETFCYGPKSCSLYRPGPNRKVPGRKGMSYTEENWGDEDATSHREPND